MGDSSARWARSTDVMRSWRKKGQRAVAVSATAFLFLGGRATAVCDLLPGLQEEPWIRVTSPPPHQWKQVGRVGLYLTREDSVVIRGRVQQGAELTIDGEVVPVNEGGRFAWELALEEGPCTVELSARDEHGVNRQALAVLRDSTPPELVLESPSANVQARAGRIILGGRARDPRPKEVLVDGEPAKLVGDRWWKAVQLSPQGSAWTVTATDQLGNSSRRIFRIDASGNTKARLSIEGLSFQRVNPDTGLEEYRHEQTGIDMVLVPGGAFRMGYEKDLPPLLLWPLSPNGFRWDQQWFDMQQQPAHTVELSSYLIARSELTRAQWDRLGLGEVADSRPASPESDLDVRPETNRTYEECRRWLDQTSPRLALPTEAQWEYACRAGTDTDYWTGDDLPRTWDRGGGSGDEPLAVGLRPANPWGLHDVHGNVAEWCEDWFVPYEPAPARDPHVLTIPKDAVRRRVIRGGYYSPHGHFATPSWFRGAHDPKDRLPTLGLRPVMNLNEADGPEK